MGTITINRTLCLHCEREFYEIQDWELGECPHCDGPLQDCCEVLDSEYVEVFVDHETGELYFA